MNKYLAYIPVALFALALALVALWLRWPTFGFSLWNVDEAIHAAAARTILDGGVMYRDAIDQRTPLTYYAVAGIFAVWGENNLWALRCGIALLIAATAFLLFLIGRNLRSHPAGIAGAILYVLLSACVLSPGDAYAANTEWFVAFFSSFAAWVFLTGTSPRKLFAAGLLYGGAFLSKQPALLDLAAPMLALIYAGWRQSTQVRTLWLQLVALTMGWITPVLATAGYFAANGALRDGIFYTWTYNLAYYGPEITTADRLGSLVVPFGLIGRVQPWLLVLWVIGVIVVLHRLMQRHPTALEATDNPSLVFMAAWTLAGLAGTAAGGRGFDHYSIQFLPAFCLGSGLAIAWLWCRLRTPATPPAFRILGWALVALMVYSAGSVSLSARRRTLPEDPSRRVATHIREHSSSSDRIFVWGYHPDIYLYADRRPASRFLYASFLSGLIPWSNTAPERDTRYAIVPGAMDSLLQDLAKQPPAFIVDCSAGPNRFWQKYPLEKFPELQNYIQTHYQTVGGGEFVHQGFRLFQLRPAGKPAATQAPPNLPPAIVASLQLGTLGTPLEPIRASAPFGAERLMVDGRQEYFAHAPSRIVYRVPPAARVIRGGFGIRTTAYAAENQHPTDGAEFILYWRAPDGSTQCLLRRLLRPREEPADRGVQSFRVELPPHEGGEMEFVITPGPSDVSSSDWTFWSDLLLENSR